MCSSREDCGPRTVPGSSQSARASLGAVVRACQGHQAQIYRKFGHTAEDIEMKQFFVHLRAGMV